MRNGLKSSNNVTQMENFSYTLSPILKSELERIERVRLKLLTHPLTSSEAIHLRWESLVSRIHFSQTLQGHNFTKPQIQEMLKPKIFKNPTLPQAQILNYRKADLYLFEEWFSSPQLLDTQAIMKLAEYFDVSPSELQEKEVNQILRFLQVNPEHPVVQAALAQLMIINSMQVSPACIAFSCLVSTLFLYKAGYDFRRGIVLEELFYETLQSFQEIIQNTIITKNASSYLEYFVQNFAILTERLEKKVKGRLFDAPVKNSYAKLTEREKEILMYLDQPNTAVSNKIVQQLFKISQITSSRDLSHLLSLNLLIPHGKGRSVTYTKA